jgi:hypothetical protein
MASRRFFVQEPISDDYILNSYLEHALEDTVRLPRFTSLNAQIPLLLNLPTAPLACREPLAEFEYLNAHFSAHVRAFFNALRTLEDMSEKQPADRPTVIH